MPISGNNSSEPLFAEERKKEIIRLLKKNEKVVVPKLCEYFNVSPATIRNDLRELERAGHLKRTHGGAIDISKVGFELNTEEKKVQNLSSKQSIAKKALEFIEDGDIIILDTGTTTLELAKLLRDFRDLTVVVNDIDIARHLEEIDGVNIILIGGTVRKNFHCTVGPLASKILTDLNVDKVFLATNGFTVEKGCTTPDVSQAEIKEIMVNIASEVIVLCDSSKIGKSTFTQFAPTSAIDVLITDGKLDKKMLTELSGQEFDLILSDPS